MAIDTAQKRMSAMFIGCPWRGPLVAAAEVGTTQGNRQAAAFLYSGILAGAAVIVADPIDIFFTACHLASALMTGSAFASPSFTAPRLRSPSFTDPEFT